MNCTCTRCGGEGVIEIQCDDCGGRGIVQRSLRYFTPPKDHPHAEEILQLKKDVARIEAQANALIELKPECAASYVRQREQAERDLEAQAQRLLK